MLVWLYHSQIMEYEKKGFKTFILHDNGFMGLCIVYKLNATYKYIYNRYYSKSKNGYNKNK